MPRFIGSQQQGGRGQFPARPGDFLGQTQANATNKSRSRLRLVERSGCCPDLRGLVGPRARLALRRLDLRAALVQDRDENADGVSLPGRGFPDLGPCRAVAKRFNRICREKVLTGPPVQKRHPLVFVSLEIWRCQQAQGVRVGCASSIAVPKYCRAWPASWYPKVNTTGRVAASVRIAARWFSEDVFEAQLDLARWLIAVGVGRKNLPKSRRSENVIGDIEIGMVGQVEELAANLEAMVLGPQRDGFGQREIEV